PSCCRCPVSFTSGRRSIVSKKALMRGWARTSRLKFDQRWLTSRKEPGCVLSRYSLSKKSRPTKGSLSWRRTTVAVRFVRMFTWCVKARRYRSLSMGTPLVEEVGRPLVKIRKPGSRSEEHTSELQSRVDLVCRLLLEKKDQDKE